MGAPRTKRHGIPADVRLAVEGLSRKSIRLLERAGVIDALAGGEVLTVMGPVARLGSSGSFARLAFWIDDDHRLNVGYAVSPSPTGPWTRAGGEFEPFTLRAYGYFKRYLGRLGRE